MLRAFFSFAKKLYLLIVSSVLSVILGFVVWGCWDLYLEERVTNQFIEEGHLLRVKVESTSTEPRLWRDHLPRVVYVTFQYNHQIYEARFVEEDTVYIHTGDYISLFYHPQLDDFRQGKQQFHFNESLTTSRLIKWSAMNTFSQENRWLVICIFFSAVFFLFSGGVLVTITGWSFIQVLGRFVGCMLLFGVTLFFSYDSWQYYLYYQHIQSNSEETKAIIVDTDRSNYYSRQSRYSESYLYTAKVDFQGAERTILIQETDYETLSPGDQISVLYDTSLDELIPVNYSLDYRQFWPTLIFWFFSLLVIWHQFIRPKKTAKPSIPQTYLKTKV